MTLLIFFNENSILYCFCDNSFVVVFMLLWPLHKPSLQLPLLPTQPECWVWSCVLCFLYSRGPLLLYLWIQSLYSWDSKICIFSYFSTSNSYVHLWRVSLSDNPDVSNSTNSKLDLYSHLKLFLLSLPMFIITKSSTLSLQLDKMESFSTPFLILPTPHIHQLFSIPIAHPSLVQALLIAWVDYFKHYLIILPFLVYAHSIPSFSLPSVTF